MEPVPLVKWFCSPHALSIMMMMIMIMMMMIIMTIPPNEIMVMQTMETMKNLV